MGERNQNDYYQALIESGCCSPHVVHGALRSGVQKTKLMVNSKPCTACLMGHCRKEKITKILLDLKVFPLPFCGHRWIKDKQIAGRALDVWPDIDKYVNETLKKPQSKNPGSSSFATLWNDVQDGLIAAKLQFFSSTATIMMPYL